MLCKSRKPLQIFDGTMEGSTDGNVVTLKPSAFNDGLRLVQVCVDAVAATSWPSAGQSAGSTYEYLISMAFVQQWENFLVQVSSFFHHGCYLMRLFLHFVSPTARASGLLA